MPNVGKLASLSKKLKQTKVTVAAGGGQEGSVNDPLKGVKHAAPVTDRKRITARVSKALAEERVADAIDDALDAAPDNGTRGAAGTIDAAVIAARLADVRDALHDLTAEVRAARQHGLMLRLSDDDAERIGAALGKVSGGEALRELADKMIVSLPEGEWFDRVGRALAGGGGRPSVEDMLREVWRTLQAQQEQLSRLAGGDFS